MLIGLSDLYCRQGYETIGKHHLSGELWFGAESNEIINTTLGSASLGGLRATVVLLPEKLSAPMLTDDLAEAALSPNEDRIASVLAVSSEVNANHPLGISELMDEMGETPKTGLVIFNGLHSYFKNPDSELSQQIAHFNRLYLFTDYLLSVSVEGPAVCATAKTSLTASMVESGAISQAPANTEDFVRAAKTAGWNIVDFKGQMTREVAEDLLRSRFEMRHGFTEEHVQAILDTLVGSQINTKGDTVYSYALLRETERLPVREIERRIKAAKKQTKEQY